MYKRILCVLLILLYVFCIVSPTFAHADFILTEALKQGIFWSLSRSVGISSENIGNDLANIIGDDIDMMALKSSDGTILGAISDYFYERIDTGVLAYLWDSIKDDIIDLGTVRYSNGRAVPNMKIKVTSSNADAIKQWGYEVQEFWKDKFDIITNNNIDWITINDIYGGYLSYMEGYVGDYFYMFQDYTTGSDKTMSIRYVPSDDSSGYCTFGMNMYEIVGEGTYRQISEFNPETNSIAFLSNPSTLSITTGSRNNGTIRYFFRFPLTFSAGGTVKVHINEDQYETVTGFSSIWNAVALMTEAQYQEWYSNFNNNTNASSNTANATQFANYALAVSEPFGNDIAITVPAGNYYLVAYLYLNHTSNYSWHLNTWYPIRDTFDVEYNNSSVYGQVKLKGIARQEITSFDITDSGTGTTITMTDSLGLVYPGMFNPDLTDDEDYPYAPDIYIPGDITSSQELNDILTTDYIQTGEIAATPSSTWPEGVSITITPPGSLGFSSIWHYVQETYDYVSTWIGQIITIWAYAVPPIIRSAAYSFVVIGIIFGIYRRLIE